MQYLLTVLSVVTSFRRFWKSSCILVDFNVRYIHDFVLFGKSFFCRLFYIIQRGAPRSFFQQLGVEGKVSSWKNRESEKMSPRVSSLPIISSFNLKKKRTSQIPGRSCSMSTIVPLPSTQDLMLLPQPNVMYRNSNMQI